jgi:hypothetical protein
MSDSSQSNTAFTFVRSLTEVPVSEELYKADLAVTDRYQTFSTELLRLSLLGIGVFGFLLKEVILNEKVRTDYLQPFVEVRGWFVAGLAALAGSAAFALAHRYVSSDCIAYQVRYLRLKSARDALLNEQGDANESARERNDEMQIEKGRLAVRLKRGGHALGVSALCLGIGVLCIAIGFSWTIFSTSATNDRASNSSAASVQQTPAGPLDAPSKEPIRR